MHRGLVYHPQMSVVCYRRARPSMAHPMRTYSYQGPEDPRMVFPVLFTRTTATCTEHAEHVITHMVTSVQGEVVLTCRTINILSYPGEIPGPEPDVLAILACCKVYLVSVYVGFCCFVLLALGSRREFY